MAFNAAGVVNTVSATLESVIESQGQVVLVGKMLGSSTAQGLFLRDE